jgi:hypothetical protein
VFELSNKRLNRVFGNLIGPWTQRCAGQPTVAGTTVGIPGRVRLLARGRPSARGLQTRRSDGGFLVRGPAAVEVADVEAIRQDPARFRARVLVPRGRGWGIQKEGWLAPPSVGDPRELGTAGREVGSGAGAVALSRVRSRSHFSPGFPLRPLRCHPSCPGARTPPGYSLLVSPTLVTQRRHRARRRRKPCRLQELAFR